jgi:hypothetical protein
VHADLARLPSEGERINGDAVPAASLQSSERLIQHPLIRARGH